MCSYARVSQRLRLLGVPVALEQVRGVSQSEGLLRRLDRLPWLEKRVAETGGLLTEQVMKLLAKHQLDTLNLREHLETPYPGYLGCIDTNSSARS